MSKAVCLVVLWAAFANAQPSRYPNLQKLLGLTETQWQLIEDQEVQYRRYISSKTDRIAHVRAELLEERLRNQPDPNALGIRYFELAAICQESTARLQTHRSELRAILTAAQLAQLARLETNFDQIPPTGEAVELNLMQLPRQDPPGWRATRNFGEPPLPGCPISGFPGVFAFIGGPVDPFDTIPNLSRLLQLSREQNAQWITIRSQHDSDLNTMREEADQLQAGIDAETYQPLPNASLLGDNALRLEQLCRRSLALEAGLGKALQLVLTPLQQERVQDMQRAIDLLPAISESQNLGLNSKSPASALPPFHTASVPSRRLEWTVLFSSGPSLPGCQPNR